MSQSPPVPSSELQPFAGLPKSSFADIIKRPPVICVYAGPGFGKSLQMAEAFAGRTDGPAGYFILTAYGNLRSFASWCGQNREEVERRKLRTQFVPNPAWTPKKTDVAAYLDGTKGTTPTERSPEKGGVCAILIPERRQDGAPVELVKTLLGLSEGLKAFLASGAVNAVIVDEMTVIANRLAVEAKDVKVAELIRESMVPGDRSFSEKERESYGRNAFAHFDTMNATYTWLFGLASSYRAGFGYVCNEFSPAYHDLSNTPKGKLSKAGVKHGDLKYIGGPDLGSGRDTKSLAHQTDITLRGEPIGRDGKRLWRRSGNQFYYTKWRSETPGIRDVDTIDKSLRDALKLDEYDIP